ncbi:PEGA domain-containing protein [bacterium]|nr:PEGA domain-containing protein [bacterium]
MLLVVALLAAVLMLTPSVFATSVAVAPLKTNSMFAKFDAADYADFRSQLRDVLVADDDVEVLSLADVDSFAASKDVIASDGCFTLDCMLELGRALGSDLVVSVALNGELRSSLIQYEVRVLDVAQGRVVEREFGSGSNVYELPEREVREVLRDLVSRHVNPKALLTVKTIPAESAVLLNNNPVGFAPLTVERPSGLMDTVTVVRHGYVSETDYVKLDPGEERTLTLKLSQQTPVSVREFPEIHLFIIGGQPLDQASSNLDSRISWGTGSSFGFRVDAGSIWRIGLGFFLYDGELDDADAVLFENANVQTRPDAVATSVHSNLFYYPGSDLFSPYFGIGVAALQRNITLTSVDGIDEERSTDFEAAWMFMVGMEAKVYGPVRFQLELMHTRTLIESDAWSLAEDSPEYRAVWERSFDDFRSMTVLRAGFGFTF